MQTQVDEPFSDKHILELLEGITFEQTEKLGIFLEVPHNKIDAAKREYRDPELFGLNVVRTWIDKWGFSATCIDTLSAAMKRCGIRSNGSEVSELKPQKTPISVTPQKLGYNHPLNTQQFKDIQDKIRKLMLAGNVQSLKRLTNDIVQRKRCKSDIKVFVLCYSVMEMTKVGSRYKEAKYALRRAKSMIGDCKNHQVLGVRIKRLHLQISRMTNSLDSCGKQIDKIEMSVDNCAPSPDTCAFFCEKAYILDRTCRKDTEYIIEQLFETAIKHCLSKSCKDNSDILACSIYIRKAMFHLKSYHRRYHEIELTEEEIHNAEEAMQAIPYDALTIARVYHYEYYLAKSHLEFHKHHILDAVSSARSALKICKELKCEDWLYVEEWIKSIQKTSGSETGTCHSTTYISSWQCLLSTCMCVLILFLFFALVLY